jgi:multiple sugar transport system permease protein
LLSFAIILLALQVYHNSTIEKPDSILAPTINIPVYMPLIPFALGWMIANTLNKYLPVRRIIPLFWDFVLLAWGFSVFSFLTSFFGEYEFGGSFVSDLADTLKAPFQVSARFLGDVFYQVIPREIATEDNLQAAQDVNFILATLVGMVTWGMVWYWLRWSSPIAARSGTFNPIRFWQNMSLKQQRYFAAFVLITPAILLRAFTTLYPFAETLALSVQKHNPAFPPRSYAGLNNFERLANDLVVRESLQFTLLFVFGSTFFQVTLGLAIAHLLNANFSLRGLARMISLIPWAIPMVVVGIASRWLFDDEFGMIPDLAGRVFGVETNWLIDPKVAKYAVITMSVWKSTPFVALVLLAGLQGIPQDLYEAARVDGASRYQQLRFVTVPMLLPIIVTTSMFMLVWQLAAFDLPFTMTGGGPGFSTTVLAQKIYLEINSLNYSFAASLGIMLVGLVMVIGGVGMYLFRRVEVTQ